MKTITETDESELYYSLEKLRPQISSIEDLESKPIDQSTYGIYIFLKHTPLI